MTQLAIETSEQMEEFGKALAGKLQAGDLLLLAGPLGAGKTTLTRGIGAGLGAEGTVQSPTFVLARTHRTKVGPKLTHVDAYRLSSAVELDDLDIDFENSIVIIEWARDFLTGYAENYLEIEIDRSSDDDVRRVSIVPHGERWQGVELADFN
jgi:tRNA threonylcarbamoyladenosine biosynthesis protein TsaE